MKAMKFITCLLLLALLSAPQLPAGEKAGDEEKKDNVVFVPYEEIDKVLGAGNRGVLLDAAEYRRLRALAKENEAIEDAPRNVIFRKAEYDGRLDGEQVVFHAKFTARVLRRGWVRTPLWFAGVALTNITIDGKKAGLRASGENLVEFLTDRRGEVILEADFRTPVRTIPSGRYITALLPAVAVSTVRLNLPGRLEVKTNPPLSETKHADFEGGPRTSTIIHLGAAQRFSCFFRGEERAAERKPLVISRQATLYTVKDRLLTADAAIDLEIFRAPVRKLTVTVPEGINLSKLETEHLLTWEVGKAASGRVPVTVELRKPLEGAGKLRVVGERILPDLAGVDFPRISIEGAERESALLGVAVKEREKLRISKADGLKRIEVKAFPVPAAGLRIMRAYRSAVASGGFTLAGSIEPETKRVTAETIVTTYVGESSLEYTADVNFTVVRGQVFRYSVSCPKGWKIHSVRITGTPGASEHKVEDRAKDQAIVIDLSKHPRPGTTFKVHIEAKDESWKDVPAEGDSFALPAVRAENVDDQTGYAGLISEAALELSTRDEKNLREEDAQSDAFVVRFEKIVTRLRRTVELAFSFRQKPYSAKVDVFHRAAQVTAATLTVLTPAEDLLKVHHLLRYSVTDAGIRSFTVVLPEGTGDNVEFKCDSFNSASRAKTEKGEPEKWTVRLSERVSGDLPVNVSYDVPLSLGNRFEAPGVVLPDVARQMGYIMVEAGEETEIIVWPENLVSLDSVRVPQDLRERLRYRPARSIIFAFTYVKPEHSLEVEVMKHPFAQVLTGVVLDAKFSSVVSTGGDARTEAKYRIETKPGQALYVSLPGGAELWSARVDSIPVKVGKYKGELDGKLRDWRIIPLGTGSPDAVTTHTVVELLYRQPVAGMATSGNIELGTPELPKDLHVLSSDWELFLPGGFHYSGFSGDLARSGGGGRLVLPHIFRSLIASPGVFIGIMIALIVILGIAVWVQRTGVASGIKMPKIETGGIRTWHIVAILAGIVFIVVLIFAMSQTFKGRSEMWGYSENAPAACDEEAAGLEYSPRMRVYAREFATGTASTPQPDTAMALKFRKKPSAPVPVTAADPSAPPTTLHWKYDEKSGADGIVVYDTSGRRVNVPQSIKNHIYTYHAAGDVAATEESGGGGGGRGIISGTFYLNAAGGKGKSKDFAGAPIINLPQTLDFAGLDADVGSTAGLVRFAGEEIRGGVASLAIDVDRHGRREHFSGRFGAKNLSFHFSDSNAYWVMHVVVSIIAFAAGLGIIFFLPKYRAAVILFSMVVFTMLPQILGSWFVAVSNAIVVGLVGSAAVAVVAGIIRHIGRREVAAMLVVFAAAAFFVMPVDAQAKGRASVSQPAPAPPAPKPDPDEEKVFVPYHPDDLGRWAELEKSGKVLIPYDRYRELYRLAFPEAPGIMPEDAGKPFIAAAEYRVSLEEKRVDVTAVLEIRAHAEGTHTLDLGLAGVPIASALLDGKPATLRTSKKGNTLLFSGRGEKKLVLQFALTAPKLQRVGAITFRIARSPQTVLVLNTDIPDLEIEVPTAQGGQHELVTGKTTTVRAYLGTANLVRVDWKPKAKATAAARERYTARTGQLISVGDGTVMAASTFSFTLGTMKVDRFLIDLPEDFKVYAVDGGNIRLWRTVTGDNVRRLEVLLHSPAEKIYELTVRGESPLPEKLGSTDLPLLSVPSARRESGSIRLVVPEEIALTLGRQENVARLSTGGRGTYGAPREYMFSYDATPIALEAILAEREVKLRGIVRTVAGVTDDAVEAASLVVLQPKGRGILTAEIEAPAGFEIYSVSGPHVSEHDMEKKDDAQLVRLQFTGRVYRPTYVLLRMRRLLEGADSFPLPRVTPVGVDRPDGEILVASAEGLDLYFSDVKELVQLDPSYLRYMLHVFRGVSPSLAFRFSEPDYGAVIHIRRLESTAEATVNLLGLVVGESLKVNAIIDYTVKNAKQKTFKFTVPKELAKNIVSDEIIGENIRSRTVSEDGTEWTITLQSGVIGRYGLSVAFEMGLDMPEGPGNSSLFDFPFINVSDVSPQRTYAVVKNMGEARLRAAGSRGAEEIMADEYPYALETTDLVGIWRAKAEEPVLRFELTQPERIAGAEISIPRALITTIVAADGTAYYETSYLVENTARQFLGVKLPAGADLWAVAVEKTAGRSVPVKPALGEGDSILIPLPKLTRGDLAFEVTLVFSMKLSSVGESWSSPELSAPEVVGVPDGTVKATYWDVTVPDDVTFTGFSGNVDPSFESDIARADLAAYMQEQDRIQTAIRQEKDIDERIRLTTNFQSSLERAKKQSGYLWQAIEQDRMNPGNLKIAQQGQVAESGLDPNRDYNKIIQGNLADNDRKVQTITRQLEREAKPAPMTDLPLALNGQPFVKAYQSIYDGRRADRSQIAGKKNFNDVSWKLSAARTTWSGTEVIAAEGLVASNTKHLPHELTGQRVQTAGQQGWVNMPAQSGRYQFEVEQKKAMQLRSNLDRQSQQMMNKQVDDLKRNRRRLQTLNEIQERQAADIRRPSSRPGRITEKPQIEIEEEMEISEDIPKGTGFDNLSNKDLSGTSVVDAYGVGGGAGGAYGQRHGRGRADLKSRNEELKKIESQIAEREARIRLLSKKKAVEWGAQIEGEFDEDDEALPGDSDDFSKMWSEGRESYKESGKFHEKREWSSINQRMPQSEPNAPAKPGVPGPGGAFWRGGGVRSGEKLGEGGGAGGDKVGLIRHSEGGEAGDAVLPGGVSIEQVDVSASFKKRSGIVSLPISVRHMIGKNRFFFRRLASGKPTLSVTFRSKRVAEWFSSLVRFLALAAIFAAAIRMKASIFGRAGAIAITFESCVLILFVFLTVVSSIAAIIFFIAGVAGVAAGQKLLPRASRG